MKKCNVNKKRKQVIVLLTVLLLVFLCTTLWYYVMIYRQSQEPSYERTCKKESNLTEERQMRMIQGFEKLSQMITDQIPIPGLNYTETMCWNKENLQYENVICTSMTPQGICIAKEYLLISAYCHTQAHNSVIFVLDKNTGTYRKTIILDGKYHAGGLAYDTERNRVWVALGSSLPDTIAGFSLQEMETYSQNQPISFTSKCEIPELENGSFITYDQGTLYVGQFKKNEKCPIYACKMDENHHLISQKELKLPQKVQGIVVYGDNILLSQSYGLTKSSLIVHNYKDTVIQLDEETLAREFIMPQKMQQIYIDDNDLYVIFESAAYAYRAQPFPKIDRVLRLRLPMILEGN